MGVKFMVHYSLELWYNTVLVLLTGNLNNAEVAINALSIWEFFKDVIHCSLNINGWEMMISLGFLAAARGKLAYIFTTSHEVASAVADLSPLLAFSILLNSVQPELLLGTGWQSIVAYINIACYYLVGIPIGVVLGYVMDMHVKGVWIGMLIETFIQTVALIIVTYRTDWEKQVIVAHNQINKWFVADPEETVA
ncbi:MULTIDRUG RESISTANCE PROTEIN [Salix koriyanagi]|uniref:MULTIDRUG RESISTANCE PROTEIN n=1 Tax=Salix koriyanagi TaxID=2511006 RepID=A0A9Q0VZE3_9ROSI|nr:MULTIDRUG RESISTANCE PROTEIN [Salix koriyanagi]